MIRIDEKPTILSLVFVLIAVCAFTGIIAGWVVLGLPSSQAQAVSQAEAAAEANRHQAEINRIREREVAAWADASVMVSTWATGAAIVVLSVWVVAMCIAAVVVAFFLIRAARTRPAVFNIGAGYFLIRGARTWRIVDTKTGSNRAVDADALTDAGRGDLERAALIVAAAQRIAQDTKNPAVADWLGAALVGTPTSPPPQKTRAGHLIQDD